MRCKARLYCPLFRSRPTSCSGVQMAICIAAMHQLDSSRFGLEELHSMHSQRSAPSTKASQWRWSELPTKGNMQKLLIS